MKDYEKLVKDAEKKIELFGWYRFGDKKFICPGEVDDKRIDFFKKNKTLPDPCDKCYKGLIFWGYCYSLENTIKFLKMIDSFNFPIRGKFHKITVVFYFREKDDMLQFLELLKKKIEEFNALGKIEWRRACKEYQDKVPEYWKNAKRFVWEQ